MFGLLREIDFVVCFGLIDECVGKILLDCFECEFFVLYEVFIKK